MTFSLSSAAKPQGIGRGLIITNHETDINKINICE